MHARRVTHALCLACVSLPVTTLTGCAAPAPIPMPRQFAESQLSDEATQTPYVSQLMFQFGRIQAIRDQLSEYSKSQENALLGASDKALNHALDDAVRETRSMNARLDEILDEMETLDPPQKYREFHEAYVSGFRAHVRANKLGADALDARDSKAFQAHDESARRAISQMQVNIERIVKASGAKDMSEFLGL